MQSKNHRVSVALVALLAGLSLSLSAFSLQAREPSTSTMIERVVPTIVSTHRADGATAWIGISQCRALAANNAFVTFRFDTRIDTRAEGSDGFSHFQKAVYYSLARGTTATVECTTDDACVEIPEADITQTEASITASVRFRTLTGIVGEAGCEDAALDHEYFVRIYVRPDIVTGVWQQAEGRVILDTVRPEPPSDVIATATPNTIRLEWTLSPSEDVTRHVAVVSTTPIGAGQFPDADSTNLQPRVVTRLGEGVGQVDVSLEAGTEVYVAMAAQDETGNYSALTTPAVTDVAAVIDFWDYYNEQGGQETGGCAVQPASPSSVGHALWLLAAALLIVRRTRRSINA
ncbi:MAG: hypothetical protein H0U74_21430 [Bradymonadaceae bacterium]|nr:hypothetical protein [Lujinxingiaceae bacterium]